MAYDADACRGYFTDAEAAQINATLAARQAAWEANHTLTVALAADKAESIVDKIADKAETATKPQLVAVGLIFAIVIILLIG